ncbi:hypothetical protein [Clostridium botulinum]|nr:hypothetical protein [Clostridium botulinum]
MDIMKASEAFDYVCTLTSNKYNNDNDDYNFMKKLQGEKTF